MKARILVNPASGRRRDRRRRVERLRRLGWRAAVGVEVSTSAADLAARARRAAEDGVSRLLVAGGDGSIHHAVQGLAGSATALGVLPAGTGNDFAAAVGAPDDLETAFRHALEAPLGAVDLGRARLAGGDPAADDPAAVRWFSTYAGVGFDGECARRADLEHRFLPGRAIYVWAVVRTLVDFVPPTLTVRHDAGEVTGPTMFVTVANGPAFGGGMRIAPAARNDDGRLDLVLVHAIPRRTLLAVFPKVYAGRHLGHPAVEAVRTRTVSIAVDREMVLYGDGEPMLPAGERAVEIAVVPSALAVCGGG